MGGKTILETFSSSLPDLPLDSSTLEYRKVTTTSASTKAEEPLKALRFNDYHSILDKGRMFLDGISPKDLSDSVSTTLTSTIKTEADVMAQSILYLLHNVNIVLNKSLKNGWIEGHLEWTQKLKMRSDYRWTYRSLDGDTLHFAVLELKAPNLLRWEDFEGAIALNDNEEKEKIDDAYSEPSGTLLVDNGKIFVQQVKKYLKNLGTKDVALFDWKHLVTLDTEGLDEDSRHPRAARFTWFEEDGKDVGKGINFHMMLLGFLHQAIDRYPMIS